MAVTHADRVAALLKDAARAHATLTDRLPAEISRSLPVDAQGLTQAIDYLAVQAGFSAQERRALVASHAINPAVLHARVFGGAPLTDATVIGAFVDGARVRAEALASLADAVGSDSLGAEVRGMLVEHPPPAPPFAEESVTALRETYAIQERAAVTIAEALDAE